MNFQPSKPNFNMYAFVCYLALWVIILKKSDRPDKTPIVENNLNVFYM